MGSKYDTNLQYTFADVSAHYYYITKKKTAPRNPPELQTNSSPQQIPDSFINDHFLIIIIIMDASDAAMLCSQANIRGTGKGCINSPNILRSSRSLEHRAPSDAELRLYPSYKDENDLVALETHLEDSSSSLLDEDQETEAGNTTNNNSSKAIASTLKATPLSPPPTERKPVALKYASQLSGRDLLADFHFMERKEAEKNHIIMLL